MRVRFLVTLACVIVPYRSQSEVMIVSADTFPNPVMSWLRELTYTCGTAARRRLRNLINGLVSVEGLLQLQVQTVRLRDLWSGGAGCLFWMQRSIERRDKRDIVGDGEVLGFRDGQSKVSLPSVAQVQDH